MKIKRYSFNMLCIAIVLVLLSIAAPSAKLFAKSDEVKKFINFESKKEFSKEELSQLDYIPDEVIIKFKKDKIDLQSKEDKKIEDFIQGNKYAITSNVLEKLAKQGKFKQEEITEDNISAIEGLNLDRAKKNKPIINLLKKYGRSFFV